MKKALLNENHLLDLCTNSMNVNIKGNSNLANTGLIIGDVTINSTMDAILIKALLDTISRNNELLEHLIRLHPTIDKEIVTSSK